MFSNRIFILKIILVLVIFIKNTQISAKHMEKRGVMDNVNEGLKYAGQMFGINTAADVANLVAKAFSSTANRNKPDFMSIFQQRQQTQQQEGSSESQENIKHQKQQKQEYGYGSQGDQETNQQQYESNEAPVPPSKEDLNGGLDFGTAKLVTNVLRMIGFDASKLGALAINALIMIAQAIGNALSTTTKRQRLSTPNDSGRRASQPNRYPSPQTGPEELYEVNEHQPRALRDGTPIDWFLESPTKEMKRLLNDITDRNLSDKITQMIENAENKALQGGGDGDGDVGDGSGGCLKMLMCKSSPFIWGMQKSLKKRFKNKKTAGTVDGDKILKGDDDDKDSIDDENIDNENGILNKQAFFTYLPSIAEYREHGRQCEQRYANYCNTNTTQFQFQKKRN